MPDLVPDPSPGDLAALAAFGAATVHEAQERTGALDAGIKPVAAGLRVCAPVMTVRTTPGSNLAVHRALYHTPPGWALAVATDGDRGFGYWGDIMTQAAITRGLAGLVIEGGVRDLAELRRSGLPIFAGAITMVGTGKASTGQVGTTISLGGVDVDAGDILVGDDDGVVRVRSADVARVAAAAAVRAEHEREVLRAIARGETTLALYGWDDGPSGH
jgi:4-hydroxy-4-methyl-2-oxoglutarate aldolase